MKTAFLLTAVQNAAKRISVGFALAVAVMFPQQDATAVSIDLGAASNFAVLAGSAITGSAGSIIVGDVGLSPTTGAAITLLNSDQVIGTIYTVNAAYTLGTFVNDPTLVGNAKLALDSAYGVAQAAPWTTTIAGNQLGGLTLVPGVYKFEFNTTVNLSGSGTLTLNANGVLNPAWIFQVPADLITASSSHVNLIGAEPGNVFWQVGTSATLGTSSDFTGNILALDSITLDTGAKVYGRVLARNAAVTLHDNAITNDFTASAGSVPDTGSTLLLLGSGLATLLAFRRRFFSPA